MTPEERYESWRDRQLEQYRLENAQLRAELEAVARELELAPAPRPEPAARWDRLPFPRQQRARRFP